MRDRTASILAAPFDVSLMAVSKHLKVMEAAGLIQREKDGRVHRCSFDPRAMDAAMDWIEMHRTFWTQQLDSLAAYLEGPHQAGSRAGEGSVGNRPPNEGGKDQ